VPPRAPAAIAVDKPASAAEARTAYLDQAVVGYLLYGVGAITAFLTVALSLSDAAAALHSSLMAVGFLAAGVSSDGLTARLGQRNTQRGAYLLLAAAAACLATAPSFAVTLVGAAMVGLGAGLLLASINRTLTRGGGALARVRMGRAALVAMLASISVPLSIGIGEELGFGWRSAFVVAAILIVAGLWSARGPSGAAIRVAPGAGPLPGRFWLSWWLIVLVVSIEFAIVFWASTLVERQVGVSLGEATLVATAFYAGMATARVGLSLHAVGRQDPVWLMRGSLAVALVGTVLAWASQSVELAALGIYLGGLGTGSLYPLGITISLALVPGLADRGSARLILASGVAILASPFLLGLAADLGSVSTAWLLIPALCLGALALLLPVQRARHT
jgi:MFS family permease